MKNNKLLLSIFLCFASIACVIISCKKDKLTLTPQPPVTPSLNQSFVEEFNNVGDLVLKGWIFKNNSEPVGASGWRQGRYEPASSAKFPVAFIGFQAYSSSNTPNDFVSCDASSVNLAGNISAWLISPKLDMKNGDQILFYSRTLNDLQYPIFTTDRMQVLANFTDSSAETGGTATSVGSFTTTLLDINNAYVENDNGGYPLEWTKYTITLSGLAIPVKSGRFAFRYLGTDAGVNGPNYASVVGVDSLAFVSQ